ncbi:calcitonin gene-related peptide type 1 receptor-like [Physella acuta]|uniref:calcitonin gene-related peptide type 1 receptor-like n=1 Tax=Physella acuta TaxID=109671 RepID=UPI0027DAD078|nr:calcitonin gene-related peptide type 1 receptor-like [Physella acuta]XP_059159935.1 calcitonin gene-related peptide type 1 receptor-like [Physella acuta]
MNGSNLISTTGPLVLGTADVTSSADVSCRYRNGYLTPQRYNLISCAQCYIYIYSTLSASFNLTSFELETGPKSAYLLGTTMVPELNNTAQVCGSLHEPSTCEHWVTCCSKAIDCCQEQLKAGPRPSQVSGQPVCPRTWDGFSCWTDTPAGQQLTITCPSYVPGVFDGEQAYKTCLPNGTWYRLPGTVHEWTDYSQCTNFERFQDFLVASVAGNVITLTLLLPACFIFLYFKQLRQQHRIRLHVCLMVSSGLSSAFTLLWELVVFQDRIVNHNESSIMKGNSVGCRLLYVLYRYTLLMPFAWMFIEGFHLHRLLVRAFSVPKSLAPYYVTGFGLTWLPILVYAIIKGTHEQYNHTCWVYMAGPYEWIIYTPIAVFLLANLIFMIRIVYIMVNQLEPHPNEPGMFRRAVKAIWVLMPLFGVQYILLVYKPDGSTHDEGHALELVYKVVNSLQGAFIAIVCCYLNREVQGYLSTFCSRCIGRTGLRRDFTTRSITMTTQYASDVTRKKSTNGEGDTSQMIPLQPVNNHESTKGGKANGDYPLMAGHIEDDELNSYKHVS